MLPNRKDWPLLTVTIKAPGTRIAFGYKLCEHGKT